MKALPNVVLSGYMPHHEAVAKMKAADGLLLVIPEIPGNEGILTGKLFEYIGSGKPILGIGPVQGDAAHILHASGAGRMVAPGDEPSMADWMQKPTRAAGAEERYTRSALTQQLLTLLP